MVVADGLTVNAASVSVPPQLYDTPPLAVKVVLAPRQIVVVPDIEAVGRGITVMVPVAERLEHAPVNGMMYSNMPLSVGVPMIVITAVSQEAVTPSGSPTGTPIPIMPIVACVIGLRAVPTHKVGLEEATSAEQEVIIVSAPVL